MDDFKEYLFLEELGFLADAAGGHATRIREIAQEWTEAGEEIKRINSLHPRVRSSADQNRRTELNVTSYKITIISRRWPVFHPQTWEVGRGRDGGMTHRT